MADRRALQILEQLQICLHEGVQPVLAEERRSVKAWMRERVNAENQIRLDFNGPPCGELGRTSLTDEERRVWRSVSDRAGRGAAILGPRIAEQTALDYVTVRSVIAHLVNDHGMLIASCSRGYYVPETPEEILSATKSLRHRAIMILLRASRLQKTSLESVFHQGRLELSSESGVRSSE